MQIIGLKPAPFVTTVRSISEHNQFEGITYNLGNERKVELYSISTSLQLPVSHWSYLLEEFSQLVRVAQTFNQAAQIPETIWGSKFPVDTLEQTSQRTGTQADQVLDRLTVRKKR